jgi:hypothetical protein
MIFVEPSLEERAGVHSRRRVPLEVDHVAGVVSRAAVEEMILCGLHEARRRCEGGNVSADPAARPGGLYDHGHGVPADNAAEIPFDHSIAREGGFVFSRDRIDVGGIQVRNDRRTAARGTGLQLGEHFPNSRGTVTVEQVVQRFQPVGELVRTEDRAHGFTINAAVPAIQDCRDCRLPDLRWSRCRTRHDPRPSLTTHTGASLKRESAKI